MNNTFFEALESNGFFSATWLEKSDEGVWGLYPDYEGNRSYEVETPFVVWIGNDDELREVAKLCAVVGVTRDTIQYKGILIEPNDGGKNCIQIRYANTAGLMIEREGMKFLGMSCGADSGNFAVIWYMGSLMGMIAASYGKFEEWKTEHMYKRHSHFMVTADNDYDTKSTQYNLGLGDSFEWKF